MWLDVVGVNLVELLDLFGVEWGGCLEVVMVVECEMLLLDMGYLWKNYVCLGWL